MQDGTITTLQLMVQHFKQQQVCKHFKLYYD